MPVADNFYFHGEKIKKCNRAGKMGVLPQPVAPDGVNLSPIKLFIFNKNKKCNRAGFRALKIPQKSKNRHF